MKPIIAPSILAADFANLQHEVTMINESQADWIHVDVMDGVFVPNISFGIPVIKAIKKHAKKPLDVHLMIVQPERYIETFRDAGADLLSVHMEASTHLHRTIQQIKAAGMKAGVAINPHTSVSQLKDVLADIDLVCMMSVNPGFGGQKFIENTYQKLSRTR
jgi:ribulose-phosphate 3-epimerase